MVVVQKFFHHDDTDENSIQYHDVCSLYPTVCTHDILPTGFPKR